MLIIDCGSNAVDFALRCQDWGHKVLLYDKPRKDGSPKLAGNGIVERLLDYDKLRSKWIDWADIVFLPENAHFLEMLEPYRQRGHPIFGCNLEAREWELDRTVGQEVMKKAGLNVLPSVEFNDYDAAARFVEKHPTYLVSKPSGDADKAMSYVAKDAAELHYMLVDRWKKNEKYVHDAKKHGFILQEKVTGVEMAIGGWFGPHGWSRWFNLNAEYKKLCNGDLGCQTGEMGTLNCYVQKEKLIDVAMTPLTKHLKSIEYVGYVDINGMIDERGEYWPFEFTTRPPWPGFHNMVALHEGDPVQWMLDLLMGRDTLEVKEDTCCVSVVLGLHPFPPADEDDRKHVGTPIYHAGDREHVHLCEAMLAEDVPVQVDDAVVRMPHFVATGGYVAVVTGTGATITGARRSAYAAVKKIHIPSNLLYRTDIGVGRLVTGLPQVQKLGYAKAFTFL